MCISPFSCYTISKGVGGWLGVGGGGIVHKDNGSDISTLQALGDWPFSGWWCFPWPPPPVTVDLTLSESAGAAALAQVPS